MTTTAQMPAAIIGAGIVSAIGCNLDETRRNLFDESCVPPLLPRKVDTALQLPVFEIPNLNKDPEMPGGIAVQLLELALNEALDDAKLSLESLRNRKIGVAIGTTVACQLNDIPFYAELRTGKQPPRKPLVDYIQTNPAEYIRRKLRLNGPALTVSNACASGADAIGIALLWLRQGLCDMVIAGGTDELNKVPLDGFNALGVCSSAPCRPFDADRCGLNLGEAAGILILSRERPAGRRLAVTGFGKSADAFHITQPEPSGKGLQKAIENALQSTGGIALNDIAFINAHGTGTQANDAVETTVFARMFGETIPFMSTKGRTGHTLGAAGAIEAIFTAIMLEQQCAVKSIRYEKRPENAPVEPLRHNLPLHGATSALSTSLAFGGSNSALVISLLN